jgi:hypothetical protein
MMRYQLTHYRFVGTLVASVVDPGYCDFIAGLSTFEAELHEWVF